MYPPCKHDLDALLPTSFPAPAPGRKTGPLEPGALLRGHPITAEAEVMSGRLTITSTRWTARAARNGMYRVPGRLEVVWPGPRASATAAAQTTRSES
jgi:hypothetical protein